MVLNATAPRAYAIRLEVRRYGTRTACLWSVWNRPAIELVALATRSIMLASRSPLRPRTCISTDMDDARARPEALHNDSFAPTLLAS